MDAFEKDALLQNVQVNIRLVWLVRLVRLVWLVRLVRLVWLVRLVRLVWLV